MAHREDDPTVPNDAFLLRGILGSWIQHLSDGSSRPQSLSFVDGSDSREVSFFIESEITVERVMQGRPFAKLARVRASVLRGLGYVIARDPDGANGETAHVVACPNPTKTRKQVERDARKIRDASEWVP